MLLTPSQLALGPCGRISGVTALSTQWYAYLNQSVRQLMRRGNWWGTVQPMRGCVYNHCITWPRFVAAVLALNTGARVNTLANRWFQFLNWAEGDSCWMYRTWRDGGRREPVSVFDGTSPVFNQIQGGTSMFIIACPSVQNDIGKSITIYGIDSNGQVAMQRDSTGNWSEGVTLTLTMPYIQSPIQFQKVVRVVKDLTQGVVRLYQWDGTSMSGGNPLLLDMASYQPNELTPDYVHTKMPTNCSDQITALVKLGWVPVSASNDLVLIENEDAIAYMIQSIRYGEQGDTGKKRSYELDAFRELNYEMRDRFPEEQFNLVFKPFGDDTLERQKIGLLI